MDHFKKKENNTENRSISVLTNHKLLQYPAKTFNNNLIFHLFIYWYECYSIQRAKNKELDLSLACGLIGL